MSSKPKKATAPSTWRSSSVAPYYTKKHGEALKPFLKELALNTDNIVTFDSRKLRLSLSACYFRIYQGWLWLIDHDDPDGFFKELKSRTRIQKGKVTITIRHGRNYNAKLVSGEVIRTSTEQDDDAAVGWRTQLTEYVYKDGDEHLPLEVTGIPFIDEDLDWIAQFMAPFKDTVVLVRLTPTSFKVCKSLKLVNMLKEKKAKELNNDSRQTTSSES